METFWFWGMKKDKVVRKKQKAVWGSIFLQERNLFVEDDKKFTTKKGLFMIDL